MDWIHGKVQWLTPLNMTVVSLSPMHTDIFVYVMIHQTVELRSYASRQRTDRRAQVCILWDAPTVADLCKGWAWANRVFGQGEAWQRGLGATTWLFSQVESSLFKVQNFWNNLSDIKQQVCFSLCLLMGKSSVAIMHCLDNTAYWDRQTDRPLPLLYVDNRITYS